MMHCRVLVNGRMKDGIFKGIEDNAAQVEVEGVALTVSIHNVQRAWEDDGEQEARQEQAP